MKTLSLILITLFAICTFAIAAGPETVKYESKMGTVTFNHAAHATQINDCGICHHTDEKVACGTCHLAKTGDAPKAKDAYHKQCKGCHKAEKAGPTKCKACHIK